MGVRHLPRVDLYWPHGGAHGATLAALNKPCRGRHATFVELERGLLDGGQARAVACVSELVREELERHYPAAAERLHLVPNGVDLDRFRPAERGPARARLGELLGWPEEVPRLSFVARHPIPKGFELCCEALSALGGRPWRLLLAGAAGHRRWLRLARARGLPADRVAVVERVDGLDLAAGVDLHLAPSRRDPCPLAGREARAAGPRPVGSDGVGAADAVIGGVGGEVLPLGAPRRWSAAIGAWLERLRSEAPRPDLVRRGVEERGLGPWLERLEELLVSTASASGRVREP
ncbi:MAG: glycosyltransferase family 4 protein [Planctomycetota bacterium]|nr:glycosyltransferase family 4 protein [Planctomycetota bacterium]